MSDQDRILHHEYDGIQEYDNPLPSWWSGIFIASIVFAAVYAWWFHFGGPGVSERAEFDRDWKAYVAWKAEAEQNVHVVVDEAVLAEMAADGAELGAGRKIFEVNCAGCHLPSGGGQLGPNLTDDFQIHGVGRFQIYQTISNGVPSAGMLAWGDILAPRDLNAVSAYVVSLRGTNVPDGKAPQGGKVERLAP